MRFDRAGHEKSLCSVFHVCYHSNSGRKPPVRLVQFQSDHFFLHSWFVWCHCYVPMFGGHPQCTLAGYTLKLARWLLTVQSGLLQIWGFFWGFFPTILCCSKLTISLEASSGKGTTCKSNKQLENLNQCSKVQIYACNFVIWPPRSIVVTRNDLRSSVVTWNDLRSNQKCCLFTHTLVTWPPQIWWLQPCNPSYNYGMGGTFMASDWRFVYEGTGEGNPSMVVVGRGVR